MKAALPYLLAAGQLPNARHHLRRPADPSTDGGDARWELGRLYRSAPRQHRGSLKTLNAGKGQDRTNGLLASGD